MRLQSRPWLAVLPLCGFLACRPATPRDAVQSVPRVESVEVARVREMYLRIPAVLAKNYKEFDASTGPVSGFGAGDAYPQIWLRDSAWIVDAAAAFYPPETLTSWLDLHLAHAEKNGRLRDWVAKGSADAFREWAPRVRARGDVAFDTNSNESDQEASAALAFCRADEQGAQEFDVAGRDRRRAGVVAAMTALLRDRTDPRTGLVWSGLTADWGDVSPLYPDQRAIYKDEKTPRTISLYTNVLVHAALQCLAARTGGEGLAVRADRLRDRIRARFWMKARGYFRIRVPLDPLPKGFEDDDARFALGGNALAALHGVADDTQAESIFGIAERLRIDSRATTVSTTLIPPYAAGTFRHPSMRDPGKYQNGGQWDWFGAPLIEAEFERGRSGQARLHLDQIAARILKAGPGIHEWYATDGSPQGSAAYAAAAAALHNTIVRGLLGITRSNGAYDLRIRTPESFEEFEIRQRTAGGFIKVAQQVTTEAIEVKIFASLPIRRVCVIVPIDRVGVASTDVETVAIVHDRFLCTAPQSGSQSRTVRFALAPST